MASLILTEMKCGRQDSTVKKKKNIWIEGSACIYCQWGIGNYLAID